MNTNHNWGGYLMLEDAEANHAAPAELGPHQHQDWRIGKAQWLRLWDIYALGPALIWFGLGKRLPGWTRLPALIGGVVTIVWNWQNYKRVLAHTQQQP